MENKNNNACEGLPDVLGRIQMPFGDKSEIEIEKTKQAKKGGSYLVQKKYIVEDIII